MGQGRPEVGAGQNAVDAFEPGNPGCTPLDFLEQAGFADLAATNQEVAGRVAGEDMGQFAVATEEGGPPPP